ncbi:unnamed protein product [Enterobius vermicularis]|uniref:Ion_trans_2 domain-containing protein n=1 Tax=Enterobius vermicularis TaxID=51028 RepID=A0A0N4VRG6_ENTVE|nr:unnamed protein product [Enterobius vermicularis]
MKHTSAVFLEGYGDVACTTAWGRIMTVIYAIVGIPLMLITLNDLGKFLFKMINRLVRMSKHKVVPALTVWTPSNKKLPEVSI